MQELYATAVDSTYLAILAESLGELLERDLALLDKLLNGVLISARILGNTLHSIA